MLIIDHLVIWDTGLRWIKNGYQMEDKIQGILFCELGILCSCQKRAHTSVSQTTATQVSITETVPIPVSTNQDGGYG